MTEPAPDVVIVGAGIIGAACARELAYAGLRVVVVDAGQPVSGTTASGEGNILVSDKSPGHELELALHAATLWPAVVAELEDELGAAFPSLEYERKGGIVVAMDDAGAEALRAFAASQRLAGVEALDVGPAGAHELEPDLSPELRGAIHYPQDAQVQPVIAAEALLASARLAGVVVRAGEEAVGLDRASDGSVAAVRTSVGSIPTAAVLIAAGPWSGEVAERFGVTLPVRPRRGVLLVTTRMPHRVHHKVYDGDYVGATQSAAADLQTSTVIESTAAGTVLIGSSRERVGFDERFRADVVSELARKAAIIFPFLAGASVMRTYGGFRPYVPDHLPVIGADPRVPGLWHATGHEGAGIGLSLATARIIAAQFTGATGDFDGSAFRVDRPALLGVAA